MGLQLLSRYLFELCRVEGGNHYYYWIPGFRTSRQLVESLRSTEVGLR